MPANHHQPTRPDPRPPATPRGGGIALTVVVAALTALVILLVGLASPASGASPALTGG